MAAGAAGVAAKGAQAQRAPYTPTPTPTVPRYGSHEALASSYYQRQSKPKNTGPVVGYNAPLMEDKRSPLQRMAAEGRLLPAPAARPGAAELQALRQRLGAGADAQTLAVGRTNVPGLQGHAFEGASPNIRTQAGLPELPASRPIQSPNPNPLFTRHAEEVLANDFVAAVERANIPAANVRGDLWVHISNPTGVCNICAQGLRPGSTVPSGVVRQLSERYPNLTIRITAEGGPARPNLPELVVRNGRIVE